MPRTRRFLALLALLALIAVGCGDDDDSSSADNGSEPAATPATGKPIKAVVVSDASDTLKYPAVNAAVTAATKAINDRGGVGGRPLQLTVCETAADANKGAGCVRTAVADPENVAIVSMWTSTGAAVFPILEEAKMAALGTFPQAPIDYKSPMAFPVSSGTLGIVGGMATLAIDEFKAKDVALAHTDNPSGHAVAQQLQQIVEVRGGKLTKKSAIKVDASDVSTNVQSTAVGSDAVVLATHPTITARYIQTAAQQGIKTPIIGPGNLDATLLKELGTAAEGVYVSDSFFRGSPGFARYTREMTATGGKDLIPDLRGINTWVGVQFFKAVLEAAGSTVDRASVLAAANKTAKFELEGMIPPVDFTTPATFLGGAFPRLANRTVYYSEVKGGAITPRSREPQDVFKGT